VKEEKSSAADRDVQHALLGAASAAKLPEFGSGHLADVGPVQSGSELLEELKVLDQAGCVLRGQVVEELPYRHAPGGRFVEDEFPVCHGT
jgi:hypothetical protein